MECTIKTAVAVVTVAVAVAVAVVVVAVAVAVVAVVAVVLVVAKQTIETVATNHGLVRMLKVPINVDSSTDTTIQMQVHFGN